jgi:outer membrane receptor protein involved in Fe transport
MTYPTKLTAALLAGASASIMAGAAYAAPAASEVKQVEEVVVTGSRVIQNGNNMPTPVTIVSAEQLTRTTPSTVIDALQQLPVFAGGRQPMSQPGNSSQNNGAHVLNLRNVGNTRTLVLFDGRRLPPTSPIGEVNADIVPSMLLQRVDVVTGGASAVYGSDAVAGVVNFITDRNFNGYKLNAHVGTSQLNDGQEIRIGFAGGTSLFDGRGHIEGSFEYYDNEGAFNKLNRDWGSKVWSMQGAGTASNPYRLVQNTRLSSTSFLGVIRSGPLADKVFRLNGVLTPFQHGTATGGNGVESGGDGAYYYQASLLASLKSNQGFGRFDFDLTDNVKFYAEATGYTSENLNNHQTNEFRNITLSAQNAFLAPEYQAAMAAAKATQFTFSKMMQQAPPLQPESHTKGYLANFGLEGKFGDGYKWDLSFVHSSNTQETQNNANIDLQRAYAALDAVRDPNGNIVCNVAITNPGLYPGCVPLNLFGPTSESAAALNYILAVTRYEAETTMNDLGGSISGQPFHTWAGPVGVAVSGEWRRTTFDLTSNAQASAKANCTGLRFNCTANTGLYISNVLNDAHDQHQTVYEGAVETNIPLLKDAAFAESLNLNGAARYTHYDTSGSVSTWKIGLDWHINSQLSFRATRSKDIRAPNLNELFAPALINPAGVTDVHTGIVGQAPFITSSNPNLVPEVAKTWTAGVVIRPDIIPNFSLALDWYNIKIDNAITTIQGQSVTIQNICEASGGTSSFCNLIVRPLPFSNRTAANFVTSFLSRPENAQTVETKGVDAEANYFHDVGPGRMSLRVLSTYQPHFTTVQFPGAPVLDAADVPPLPKWRVAGFLKYQINDFSVDIQQRWRSGYQFNPDRTLKYDVPRRKAVGYTNLTLTYQLKDTQIYGTVENLFDKQPEPFGGVGGASGVPGLFGGYPQGDDIVGRYFIIGFRMKR